MTGDRPRLLAIMGSGETAPTMAKVHRLLVERLGPYPVDAVLLDTPYGFQENAAQISRNTAGYFERAAQQPLGVAFSSAAAMTLRVATVPVCEVYEVGAAPHWLQGLDLLAVTGLRTAVIAHYERGEAERLERTFDAGLRGGDVRAAVSAILELEQVIVDWSAATEEEDGADQPRAVLRHMVMRLGEVAAVRDPRERVAPLVDTIIEFREQARGHGEWTVADSLRERLTAAGIEVRDTPDGTVWLPADL